MKAVNVILKIVAVLAAIAGVFYILATYGDKIAAWCKEMLGKLEGLFGKECECETCSCQCDADCEECPCEDDCEECSCDTKIVDAEEAPIEETVQAEEADFEG